jgi:sugar lactone lactonase YvrE
MKAPLLALILISIGNSLHAQEKIRTIDLTNRVMYASIDRPGDFYTIGLTGEIRRYDRDGNVTLIHKPDFIPTIFDPRDGARLFIYDRQSQRYQFLSPSFEPLATFDVEPSFAVQPWLVCPSGDFKLWILDKADHSLRKVNMRNAEVELEAVDPVLSADGITTMRDYQGFLFLLDPAEGIHVFNALGKRIRTLEIPGLRTFNFLGEELYYVRDNHIEFFNLFTTEYRRLKIPDGYTDALLTDERMTLIAPDRIDIFPFAP